MKNSEHLKFLAAPAAILLFALLYFFFWETGARGNAELPGAREFQASLGRQMSDPGFRQLLQRAGELQSGTAASSGRQNMAGSVQDILDPLTIQLPR